MTATVAIVFNLTINCHVLVKYFDHRHEHIDESTLESSDSIPLISRTYDCTFFLKTYKFIYML